MKMTRRQLIASGFVSAAGLTGVIAAASRSRLIPPDSGGIFGAGETLTYAAHRLLLSFGSSAREFRKEEISASPLANGSPPKDVQFQRLQARNFVDWRLTVEGMVAKPAAFSMEDLKAMPRASQVTQLGCEEGWTFIAEWIGVPLSHILDLAGAQASAKYVVYFSHDPEWWDSVDIDEARHPQTLLTYGMNSGDLPVGHGAPLRMRVPRQLGYKSVKHISRILVTDSLHAIGDGRGSGSPAAGYSWYAGI